MRVCSKHSAAVAGSSYSQPMFNLILLHGYVPSAFGQGVVVPLLKDRLRDTSNLDNTGSRNFLCKQCSKYDYIGNKSRNAVAGIELLPCSSVVVNVAVSNRRG